jgi:hypothetical protein
MSGQIKYTLIAISVLTWAALDTFRYRTGTYWDAYVTLSETVYPSVNYFTLGNLISGYGTMAIFGVATITQLLSNFGILADINLMVWVYGVFMGATALGGVTQLLNFFAMNLAYNMQEDSSSTSAEKSAAAALYAWY